MKKTGLILAVCLSIPFACFAEEYVIVRPTPEMREKWRDADRSIVFSAVEKHAQYYTEGRNFLVFSILGIGNKSHLIVIEEDGFFRELRIRNNSLMHNVVVRRPSEILRLAFHKEIYHTGTKFISDFPEKLLSAGGNRVYFVFVDKDKSFYGESITNVFGPLIDRNVHFYLMSRLLNIDTREQRWHHRFRFMRRR